MGDVPENKVERGRIDRTLNKNGGSLSRGSKDDRARFSPTVQNASTRYWTLWAYIGLAGSLSLRISLLDFESHDYIFCLRDWYDYFIQHGRWAALKGDFSTYPPLYSYLLSLSTLLPLPKPHSIKLSSILCDYIAAWFAFKIVRCKYPSGPAPLAASLTILFLPTVWLNSAVWGQCDVIFTTALLATLYYLIVNKPTAAMVGFGFACSLKPQAIFFVPFLGGWFFRERFSWKCVLAPPLVYALCGLPAILAGKPVLELLFHFWRQKNFAVLTQGATNWYQWISNEYFEVFYMAGIILTMVVTAFFILSMRNENEMQPERATLLITTALLSVLVVPYFLPGMHERYFFAADLFSVIYAFFTARGWIVALLIQFCSFFAYLPYLFEMEPIPRTWLALIMTAAVGLLIKNFVELSFCLPKVIEKQKVVT